MWHGIYHSAKLCRNKAWPSTKGAKAVHAFRVKCMSSFARKNVNEYKETFQTKLQVIAADGSPKMKSGQGSTDECV